NRAQRIRVAFAELGRELPAYMRLADFVLTREPLPRNRLGKYRRRELVPVFERAERGEAPPPSELSAADRERLSKPRARRLMDYLAARFPDRPIGLDTSLQMELGIDSLSWVDLQLGIERRVGVVLSEAVVAEVDTVRDLLEAVGGAAAADASGAERLAARETGHEVWLAPRGRVAQIAGFCLHALARLVMRLLFRPSVTGLDRIPRSGPVILALNHASDLDPVAVGTALPYPVVRRSWWSADAARVFGSRLGRAL